MFELIIFTFSFGATLAGVAAFKRLASSKMMDLPNERSSHSVPTPRGAGLVIVAVCLLAYIAVSALIGPGTNWSYIIGAVIVSGISWIDDIVRLPVSIRFASHGLAAVVLIAGSGTLTEFTFPGISPIVFGSTIASIVTFGWIVWMINSYNFMDGIDGIAGGQAVVAGLAWAAFGILSGDSVIYMFGGSVAFACLGFLFYNWSPASVFMGDVGSAFLGYTLAAITVIISPTAEASNWVFLAAVTFVWMFIFDTVFTFIRRLSKRERVWLAHRQHLYQRLIISGWKHSSVSLLYLIFAAGVAAAFIAALQIGGNSLRFFLLSYIISAGGLSALVYWKKN